MFNEKSKQLRRNYILNLQPQELSDRAFFAQMILGFTDEERARFNRIIVNHMYN